MQRLAPALLLVLVITSAAVSQELSTEVYPSEDELYLALAAGDIDYHQLLILREVIRTGIDVTNRHLLDEVPNLSYFHGDTTSLSTNLQREQADGFDPRVRLDAGAHGEFRYRYYQYLEEASESQYRASIRWSLAHWTTSLFIQRDHSGVERIARRCVAFRRSEGRLRELRLGNYTRRLGLGTAFGYRGKLLDFSERLEGESFLFPDYGAYNGVYVKMQVRAVQLQLLSSFNRDADHSLATVAGMAAWKMGSFSSGFIVGVNRLRNRHLDKSLYDVKIAPLTRYRYRGGYTAMEICAQAGKKTEWGGMLIEGRHRFNTAQIKYAAWSYGESYLDLSGGSKSGRSRRTIYLEDVDFQLSEKRSGHQGGMIKTIVLMSSRTHLVNSLLYSGQHRDSSDLQLLSGLLRQFHPRLSLRLDHLIKSRRRVVSSDAIGTTSHRTRLEVRFTTGQAAIRGYIAYNTKSGRSDYISAFIYLDYPTARVGRLQLWSNLARLDGRDGTVDYWYLFLRNEQTLWDGMTMAVKMSRTYDRDAGERHRTTLSLEVQALW
ncbi:MAG: hypothetical protein KAW46_04890 [candidate division Zixibacteria bacterium]|nr:hypothetical protein [candidate division Zixibacteria bacterium]